MEKVLYWKLLTINIFSLEEGGVGRDGGVMVQRILESCANPQMCLLGLYICLQFSQPSLCLAEAM